MFSAAKKHLAAVSFGRMGVFSLNRLWVYLCFWSTLVYLSPGGTTGSMFNSVHGISNLASAATLIACGCMPRQIERLLDSRFGAFAAALVASVGTAALAFSPSPAAEIDLSAVLVFGSVATGLGSGIVLMDIARQYAHERARTIAVETTLAFVVAALAYALVSLIGTPAAVVIAIVAPLLVVGLPRAPLRHARENAAEAGPAKSGSDPRRPEAEKENASGNGHGFAPHAASAHGGKASAAPANMARPLAKLIAGIVFFSIPVEFMRGIYTQTQFDTFSSTFALFLALVTCVVCAAVTAYCLLAETFRFGVFFKLMIPITICGFIIAPLLNQIGSLALALTSVGYCLFQIMTWVLFACIATRLRVSPVRIFGLGNGLMRSVGILIGSLVTFFVTQRALAADTLTTVSLFAVAFLALTFLVAFTEKDLEALSASLGNDPGKPLAKKVPLQQRCDIIGLHYGLSPREREIFRLLAIGRNAKVISEELCLARGTMNTHMRNIYRKLDVHSQQELIDLMQEADLDAIVREDGEESER